MPICSWCKIEKSDTHFNILKSGKPYSHCRECVSQKNKAARLAKGLGIHANQSKFQGDTKSCTICKQFKPLTEFNRTNKKIGYQSSCKLCAAVNLQKRRRANGVQQKVVATIIGDTKDCTRCKERKPLENFIYFKGRYQALCRLCRAIENAPKKPMQRQKYKEEHYEKWIADKRIATFKRRTKLKVASDGSVTSKFLKELYATEHCFYCKTNTSKEKRTLDHKMPLSRGGRHTAENVVMACAFCNSKKSNKTSTEFLERLKDLNSLTDRMLANKPQLSKTPDSGDHQEHQNLSSLSCNPFAAESLHTR